MNLKKKIKPLARMIATSFTLIAMVSQALLASSSIKQATDDTDYIVYIDGGGSKTSLQVFNAKMEVLTLEWDGKPAPLRLAGSTNINVVGCEETKNTLKSLLHGLKISPDKQELKAIKNKSIICGLAGLSSNADERPSIRDIFLSFGFQDPHIVLSSDVEIAKQLIGEQGAILIAGTGSICLSKISGKERRIGGYGYILGDEGSGFYVGKLALQVACDSASQDKPFCLTEKLCSQLNVSPIMNVIKEFYRGIIKNSDVAKIAPLVFEAAFKENDQRCKAIVQQCATELAKHVILAVEGSSQSDFPIYLLGGIFKNENVDHFIEMIRQKVTHPAGIQFINIAQKNIVSEVIQRTKCKDQ